MRHFTLLIVLWFALQSSAIAVCADAPPGDQSATFVRTHKIYHFNGDEPSGGVDQLTIWNAEKGNVCFLLNTSGPNYHECDVSGMALRQSRSKLMFKDGNCILTFQLGAQSVTLTASRGWERMGRGGTCTARRCGMFGEVESGTFHTK